MRPAGVPSYGAPVAAGPPPPAEGRFRDMLAGHADPGAVGLLAGLAAALSRARLGPPQVYVAALRRLRSAMVRESVPPKVAAEIERTAFRRG